MDPGDRPKTEEGQAMKSKTYQVSIDGVTYLVEALTLAVAVRDVVAEIASGLAKRAVVDLATGEQLYHAGKKGLPIIGWRSIRQSERPEPDGADQHPRNGRRVVNGRLVLKRREGEAVVIDGDIIVTVVHTGGGAVTLAFEAPPEVEIWREELVDLPSTRGAAHVPG